jgi:predicted Zn-dependent protease
VEFHLVRAKLRAQVGDARDAVAHFESAVRERRHASESAARYGLALALLRARRPGEAQAQIRLARAAGAAGPMVEIAEAQARQAQGDAAGGAALLEKARARNPRSRALVYAHVSALQDAVRHPQALEALESEVREHPRDARLRALQAKSFAALGKRFQQHQAQAEVYALQGSLPAAIEQLELARRSGDADFYQLSVVDARLRELRAQHAQELKDAKK